MCMRVAVPADDGVRGVNPLGTSGPYSLPAWAGLCGVGGSVRHMLACPRFRRWRDRSCGFVHHPRADRRGARGHRRLARSDAAAAAVSALGAEVRRGDLQDLDGLKEAAADSDGVIHVEQRQDLLPSGGIDAVAAAELPVMLAYGEALAGTRKPLVAAGSNGSPSIGSPSMGRPATEEDPALPVGDEHKGTLRVRNVVEAAVVGLAERGVRSSVGRLPQVIHSTTDAGFLKMLIALAKEKGAAGYPGDGANLWGAVHARDAASLFRLALEKGPAGRYWHAVEDGGIPFREIPLCQTRVRQDESVNISA